MTTYTPRHTAYVRSDRDNRLRWGDVTDSLGTYRGLVSVSDLPADPPARHRGSAAADCTIVTTYRAQRAHLQMSRLLCGTHDKSTPRHAEGL